VVRWLVLKCVRPSLLNICGVLISGPSRFKFKPIKLMPFSLAETDDFLKSRNILFLVIDNINYIYFGLSVYRQKYQHIHKIKEGRMVFI